MGLLTTRRSVMTLFSGPRCPESHRVRVVLAEKGIAHEVVDLDPDHLPEDLIEVNPYNSTPTLLDRDLALFNSRVIMEYLDERFPHPPLMPVDPVARARIRLALFRVEHDWYSLVPELESRNDKKALSARKLLRDGLTASNELFAALPFFLSEELTLLDCTVAPLLWRLAGWGIELPPHAKAVKGYMDRLFARPAFRVSLSEPEREMRDD